MERGRRRLGMGALGVLVGLLGHGGCAPTPEAPVVRLTAWTPKVLPDVKGPLYKWHLPKYLRAVRRSAPLLDAKTHPHGFGKGECARCHELAPSANIQDCAGCHGSKGGSDAHANGALDVVLVRGEFIARVRPGETPSCTNSDCHETRKWSLDSCAECHGYPPSTGSHRAHLLQNGELRPEVVCESCHRGFQHESGQVDIRPGVPGFEAYDALAGTCSASCHEKVVSTAETAKKPKRESKWGCTDCHGMPPDSGNHAGAAHRVVPCGACHAGHSHSDATVKSPKAFHAPSIEVGFAGGGTYRNGFCATSCHEAMKWGESCGSCHGYPPETGDHVVHVRQEGMLCRDCHADNDHDLVRETGSIDVKGPFAYEPATGSCTTTCHEKEERWNCTSCHAYPPDDGIHPAHAQPKERFWDWTAMSARMKVPDLATNGVSCAFCINTRQTPQWLRTISRTPAPDWRSSSSTAKPHVASTPATSPSRGGSVELTATPRHR